jgi:SPP1 family predicted phage head-tail adaptor
VRIGRLHHQVTIVEVATEPGQTGAPEATETVVATVWAEIRTPSGSEQLSPQLEAVGSSTLFVVTIRHRSDVRPTMVLQWDDNGRDRVLQVKSIFEPDNRQRTLQLVCTEEL